MKIFKDINCLIKSLNIKVGESISFNSICKTKIKLPQVIEIFDCKINEINRYQKCYTISITCYLNNFNLGTKVHKLKELKNYICDEIIID